MKDYEIQTFDIASASKEEWSKYHNYRKKRFSEVLPDDPIEDDLSYQEWAKASLDEFNIRFNTVTTKDDSGQIIASLQLNVYKKTSPSYSGNEHTVIVRSMSVLKEHRRRGIGRALLRLVHEYAVENGKSVILGGTMEEDGRELNRILGGTEALEMRNYRLNMDKVDWDMVKIWEQEGAKKSPDTSLEFYTSIPDDLLEGYTKKYTEVYNQAPFDDLDIGDQIYTPDLFKKYEEVFEKAGETWLSVMLREKNGDISGLSDVFYIPSKSPMLTQGLTGVVQNYRGQGKGKWVKAAMLLKIRDEFPDIKVISTGNATSNAPMIAINERLGFNLHHETYNMQIDTDKLGKYLKERQ
jgi:GNAT superfamily N-acetyltransferase